MSVRLDVMWRRTDWDGRVHGWTGRTAPGVHVALCDYAVPPNHVICDTNGDHCQPCAQFAKALGAPPRYDGDTP